MRSALSRLRLHQPKSLEAALDVLAREPGATPLAGGTDVYVALNAGTLAARTYVDLWGLRELRGIRRRAPGGLTIGAGATFAEIAASPLVRRHLSILAQAARQIGGVQIQNRATIGGNIANASPAADAVPVLLAAEATFVLVHARGERRVPATTFFTGYRKTAMARGELIHSVEIPALPGPAWFRKVGTRAANAISKVVMAGVRSDRPRIALGSVGPTTLRAARAEVALAAGASLEDATRALHADIAPIDDLRSTADYRRRVAAGLLRQFWEETSR
jgi:CO/xanthine dehydrogenase FAD-binding subunit